MASSCPSRATFNLPLFSVPLEAHLSGPQWAFPGLRVSSWVWQGMTRKGKGDDRERSDSLFYWLFPTRLTRAGYISPWKSLLSQRDQCYRTFTFQIQITAASFHLVGPGWYRLSTTYLHCSLWLPYTHAFGKKSSFNGPISNMPFVPDGNFLHPLTPIHPSEQSKSHHL